MSSRDRILSAVADQLVRSGIHGNSLRDLANAAGVSHRTLLYHFGTRDELVLEALRELRDRQYTLMVESRADAESRPHPIERVRAIWKTISAPESSDGFKLFFEAYANAVRDPERHRSFLDGVVHRWVGLIEGALAADEPGLGDSEAGTLLMAAIRGLHLDLLATGDHARVDRALDTLLRLLDLEQRTNESPA